MIALSVSAVAALSLFMLALNNRRPTPAPDEAFVGRVMRWTEEVREADWSEDLSLPYLQDSYPPARKLRSTPRGWRRVATEYDPHAIVYNLTPRGQQPVYLYCLRSPDTQSAFPAMPPAVPLSTTGGLVIGAWQHKDLLYVLAVRGDVHRYQRFVGSRVILGWRGTPCLPPV
jgi:hypothetical protein